MADTLPSIIPSYSTKGSYSVRVLRATFGDGYSQRTPDGINSINSEWDVVWELLSLADAQTLEDFFVAKKGAEHFLWTPPRSVTALKFTVATWDRTPVGPNHDRITAKFIQEFDVL